MISERPLKYRLKGHYSEPEFLPRCRNCDIVLTVGSWVVSKKVRASRHGPQRRELYCLPCAEELCII